MCAKHPMSSRMDTLPWLQDGTHQIWLRTQAFRLLDTFRTSLRRDGGFDVLGSDTTPLPCGPQELHTTTRLIHSFALGKLFGAPDCDDIIDAGMRFLWDHHRDQDHGGYVWSIAPNGTPCEGRKLAYGHVFVLLAASSAKKVGHPDADRFLDNICDVLDHYFWDAERDRFREEFERDWQSFSTYRGMNANMHGVEALLAAFEATGKCQFLDRAGRILDFFIAQIAPQHGMRIPEHFSNDWTVDHDYAGDPMFRPPGTTPGHSVEWARLALQYWDLSGRPASELPDLTRSLIYQALSDAWHPEGGLIYTLDMQGNPAISDRYWWPVTEAIGAIASLLKMETNAEDETWYRRLWTFSDTHLIDHKLGGWFPELDTSGQPSSEQFQGKPDIYHALQALLLPLDPRLSRIGHNKA